MYINTGFRNRQIGDILTCEPVTQGLSINAQNSTLLVLTFKSAEKNQQTHEWDKNLYQLNRRK